MEIREQISHNPVKTCKIEHDIRTHHLNSEERFKILSLCKSYADIFYNENCNLSFSHAIKHKIRLTNETPIHTKLYRYPQILKEEVQNQIQKLLENNIIRPSISPYSATIWLVLKKSDASGKKKWRLVVDYRKINEKTVDDKYPFPQISEILDNLGKSNYFTTLDHQIEMNPDSIEKTAFTVDNGHFEYLRMPFGLKNAPATFQRIMDCVLREFIGECCFVYMDDVVIFSKSLQEHLIHIKNTFSKFREYILNVQIDKYSLGRKYRF